MTRTELDGLPYVDEHAIVIDAAPEKVWSALVDRLPGFAAPSAFARLVGARPARSTGTIPEQGAEIPGFALAEVVAQQRVRLAGRHHFSTYALLLELRPEGSRTKVTATTYAVFPGWTGALYRLAVIGSRAHLVLVRRLLRDTRAGAELR
ncbi:hypothetical protein [Hamadaea tsunoensis]|uniref:hypothetical protein n=1 Tax=Hamadaea tsunoensis TaxID=53368 RepID=UPI000410D9EE|nr:hypothetical protein [Hamadaea tsunoensis]